MGLGALAGSPFSLVGSVERWDEDPFVARVTKNTERPNAVRDREVLIIGGNGSEQRWFDGFRAILSPIAFDEVTTRFRDRGSRVRAFDPRLSYLADGDVIRLNPRRGQISVMYRRHSDHNSIFLTERCNSLCLMCSQPPRELNDDFLLDDWVAALPLISRDTATLGITGGEPTLLGDRFISLLRRLKAWLPATRLHVLSNGRRFSDIRFARKLGEVEHRDLTVAVPLFGDTADLHNYLAQTRGAFDETILGLLNLARLSIPVEVRIVIQKANARRLIELARFIALNLPFVRQVSLMGLEPRGFAQLNSDAVWIDPYDYRAELSRAVNRLQRAHLNTVVMNHQLCVTEPAIWPITVRSISDYKNMYLPVCDSCNKRTECTGFFASAKSRHSTRISPLC